MIIHGPLPESSLRRSQRFYALYNFFNGLSYMCLGETVIILLAVKLQCPDYVVAILGSLLYFSYVLLPTGKFLAAHIGAASSQAVFWVLRNTAALLVASSAIWYNRGNHQAAVTTLLGGAFLFYGCRAAGIVMIQPLLGNITTESDRPTFLGISGALFYLASFIALVVITFILRISESLSVLTSIIVVGSVFGYSSAYLLHRVDESSSLRDSARQPLLPSWRRILGNQCLRRQISAGLMINLALILTIPMSMLTVKRGYGLSDRKALYFALAQLAGSFLLSRRTGRLANLYGPRKIIIGAYVTFIIVALCWITCPKNSLTIFLMPLFFILGAAAVLASNSITHYFLQSTPVPMQVNASILIYVCAGGCGGLLGLAVSAGLLKMAAVICEGQPDLYRYRLYFSFAAIILIAGFQAVKSLIPLPADQRQAKITWQNFF